MSISDAAVRVVEERLRFYTGSPGADWTAEAIAIVEAAAPYMLAEAWQAGYDIGCDRTIDAAPNPYED